MTPVFKKEDSNLAKNYRPGSVLPIFQRFWKGKSKNKLYHMLINSYQTSCVVIERVIVLRLHCFNDRKMETLDKKGYSCAITMNLTKTFDTIFHELLLAKLYA